MDKKHTIACFECGAPLLASYRTVQKRCQECWRRKWRERQRRRYATNGEHMAAVRREWMEQPGVRERKRQRQAINRYVSEEAAARGVPRSQVRQELERPRAVVYVPTREILSKIGKSPANR